MTPIPCADLPPDSTAPSLAEYLTAVLDEVAVPTERDGQPLTIEQRHALMMGRYAEIVGRQRAVIGEWERSQHSLLALVRKAKRHLDRGHTLEAKARLAKIVIVEAATRALRS